MTTGCTDFKCNVPLVSTAATTPTPSIQWVDSVGRIGTGLDASED